MKTKKTRMVVTKEERSMLEIVRAIRRIEWTQDKKRIVRASLAMADLSLSQRLSLSQEPAR